jgi:hypothetical protein
MVIVVIFTNTMAFHWEFHGILVHGHGDLMGSPSD